MVVASNPQQTIIAPAEAMSDETLTPPYDLSNKKNTYSMDVNYAHQNKWYAYFPLEDILGSQFKNLNLHITRFTIPQLQQSSQTVSYRGYEKQIPGKVLNPSTKQLNIEYIVDAEWNNYKSLYSWMSGIVGVINPITTDEAESKNTLNATDYIPLRIYLVGPYKKKIIQFKFSNTWIETFGDIQMDVNSPGEVMHSFTLVFDEYTIENC